MSGYFEIGIYHPKTIENIGTLWRSAYQLGAAGIFTIGERYKHQSSDTHKTPSNIPLRHYADFAEFIAALPVGAQLVGVEFPGQSLSQFQHPRMAVYLLGAEDAGLPQSVIDVCQFTVAIESVRQQSYNVAVAGSLVMWHRLCQRPGRVLARSGQKEGIE